MVDPDQSAAGLSGSTSGRRHTTGTDEPCDDSQRQQSERLTCRIKAVPIPIHAGAEGEAGLTPAHENHASDRWIRPTAGCRTVFAIEGILWLVNKPNLKLTNA